MTAIARFGGIVSTAVMPAPGTVSVLLGNGDGTFQAPRNFAVGSGAHIGGGRRLQQRRPPGLRRQRRRLQFRVGLHELGQRQLFVVELFISEPVQRASWRPAISTAMASRTSPCP